MRVFTHTLFVVDSKDHETSELAELNKSLSGSKISMFYNAAALGTMQGNVPTVLL